MRHPPSAHRRQRGSTLMTTLFMSVVTLSFLGTCLAVVSTRYKITTRSRCWNAALPLAEAGVEEALTHIQNDTASSTANGWSATTLGGLPVYVKQRNFSDGSYYYMTLYNASSNNPIVYSTGFVPAPLQNGNYLSRTVKVSGSAAQAATTVNVAFGAVDYIQFKGSGVTADSFDSSNPALSTNGQYDPKKTANNGNLASYNGAIDLDNCALQGNVYLAPGAQCQSSASQVSGKIYSNAKLSFPDAALPNTTWLPAPITTVGSGKSATQVHAFVLDGDYFVIDSLDITVAVGVNVRLRVDTTKFSPGNVSILSLPGSSGNLTVYQVSGSCDLSGNISVASGQAKNFYVFGLPNVDTLTLNGKTSFTGVIYAPEADFTLKGSGNGIGFFGASVTKTISLKGNYALHYDEALSASASAAKGFTIASWQEL